MNKLKSAFSEITKYPSAILGLGVIGILLLVSLLTVIFLPYGEAIDLWRGADNVWSDNPRLAKPAWTNVFRANKLAETIIISTVEGYENNTKGVSVSKTPFDGTDELSESVIDLTFDYPFSGFPQEMTIFFVAEFAEKEPFIDAYWVKPDGSEVRMGSFAIGRDHTYRLGLDEKLQRRLDDIPPYKGLLVDDPTADAPQLVNGEYTMRMYVLAFEPDVKVDARLVIYGQAHGFAGTDHRRRDLTIPMLWGIPIALSFGLLAALGTSVTTMVIAAIGVWFGGWLDELIQRITEVNLVLPVLPILIMVGTFYSRSIWVILGVIILLSIFGGSIKTYRAIFLQVKESPYIEAARAYGAKDLRIVFRYLIPRVIPLLVPGLVTLIPSFVFLEASLAVLGLGDPVLPTWGKMIDDARSNGALFEGHYYWVLQPSVLLMVTGLAFAMLGYSLDRVFNPRLRGI